MASISYDRRIERVKEKLSGDKLNAVILFDPLNIAYLTGFDSASACIVPLEGNVEVIVPRLEYFRARDTAKHCEVVGYSTYESETLSEEKVIFKDLTATVIELVKENISKGRVGVEASRIRTKTLEKMRSELKDYELVDTSKLITDMRMCKDEEEINAIKEAIKVAEEAMGIAVELSREGITEAEVASEVLRTISRKGLLWSFNPIIASGPNSAYPHAVPTTRRMSRGDIVVIDLGARYKGYCSDMTRTIIIGEKDSKYAKLYNAVLEAQVKAIEEIGPGVSAAHPDRIARKILKEKGLIQYFNHSLGHGVGLAVHEAPALSPKSENVVLKPGVVVTVEPGVYIPGYGGIRIEDMVLVTEDGCKVLTSFPK